MPFDEVAGADVSLSALLAALSGLPGGDPTDWSCAELQEAIPELLACESRLAAVRLAAIAAFDAVGGGQIAGYRSTGDWLTKTARVGHAGGMVATARALRDDLPATAKALASGCISEEHVRVIRRAHKIFGEDFATVEDTMVEYAQNESATGLKRLVELIIQQYRPEDFSADADAAHGKRKVFLSRSLDGWWHLTGLLDPVTGARLRAAFDVFADAASADDDRSPAARRNDAIAEIAARALVGIDRDSGHGQIVLHLDEQQLSSGRGVAWPTGGVMPADDVAALTCSAEVAAVIHDADWQPVALGVTRRFATAAQRTALRARDGDTCVHSGCSTQASRCIAHHIVHWDAGGPTDLPNLVLLCEFHHRQVHHGKLHLLLSAGSYTTTRQRQQA